MLVNNNKQKAIRQDWVEPNFARKKLTYLPLYFFFHYSVQAPNFYNLKDEILSLGKNLTMLSFDLYF